MKTPLKKSKHSKVITWLSNNKDVIGADKSFFACDIVITRVDDIYTFEWNGIKGSIECANRPKPTTLKIFTNQKTKQHEN